MLPEKIAVFILSVADIENSAQLGFRYPLKKLEQVVPMYIVKALGRFIQEQEFWHFYQCSSYKNQPLFTESKLPKRFFFQIFQPKSFQPLAGLAFLSLGIITIQAD